MTKFPIVFDNLIFSLQTRGGISRFWSELISVHLENDLVRFLEYQNYEKNIFRPNINKKQIDYFGLIPLFLQRSINPNISSFNEKFIFHSSYYRICTDKNAINIVTVHDLMHEIFLSDLKSRLFIKQKNHKRLFK